MKTIPPSPQQTYSLPTKEIDIKNQELALRRFAPQRLIFHGEVSSKRIALRRNT